jgi:hypothetical protein
MEIHKNFKLIHRHNYLFAWAIAFNNCEADSICIIPETNTQKQFEKQLNYLCKHSCEIGKFYLRFYKMIYKYIVNECRKDDIDYNVNYELYISLKKDFDFWLKEREK